MKMSEFRLFMLCASVFMAIALFSISCAGPGYTDGSIDVNIADQPVWGPTGYDRADFYYIPDIDCYYSVTERQYIYKEGTEWKHAETLPPRYGNYDPYHSYKVVVNKKEPYLDNDNHKSQYGKFKGVKDQPVIRDSKDPKYFINKDHPQHDSWVKDHH